jgi:hypothetical protein
VIAAAFLVISARFAPQPSSAQVDPITVCAGECDHKTIQAAIDDPSTDAGDTIRILNATHTEAGIAVTKSVTIVGANASGTIVQAHEDKDAASDRVLTVVGGASATIQNVTVRHGKVTGSPARGGGILNEGSLTLEKVAVTDNLAIGSDSNPGGSAEGGGIYNNGLLILVRSVVSNSGAEAGNGSSSGANGGDGHGGGIANGPGGALTAVNSTISGNRAVGGYGFG